MRVAVFWILAEILHVYVIVATIAAYRLSALCGVPDAAYALWLGATWPWWIRTML